MLPEFPEAAAVVPPLCDALRSRGISLRSALEQDLPFLRDLHAGFRAAEMAFVPWPAARKRAFLDAQFGLQHIHFTTFFPHADFWIVEQALLGVSHPIGRLYLDRSALPWRIVDIGLTAEARGRGLGAALIAWVQRGAQAAGGGLVLQVADNNPRARALYVRLGFAEEEAPEHGHQAMAWRLSA